MSHSYYLELFQNYLKKFSILIPKCWTQYMEKPLIFLPYLCSIINNTISWVVCRLYFSRESNETGHFLFHRVELPAYGTHSHWIKRLKNLVGPFLGENGPCSPTFGGQGRAPSNGKRQLLHLQNKTNPTCYTYKIKPSPRWVCKGLPVAIDLMTMMMKRGI